MPAEVTSEQLVALTPASDQDVKPAGASPPADPAKPGGGGNLTSRPQTGEQAPPPGPSSFRDDEALTLEPDEYAELTAWRQKQEAAKAPPPPPAPEVESPESGDLPAKPSHPASLVEHAKFAGIPQAEIDALSSADLGATVDRALRVRQLQAREQPRPPYQQPPQQPQSPPPPAPPTPQELVRRLGLDPDELDAGALEIAGKMAAHYEERFAKIEPLLQRYQETEAQQRVRQNFRALDPFFAGNAAAFGPGATEQLDPASPEFFRRQTVLNNLVEMQRAGRHGRSLKDDFEAVHRNLFGFAAAAPPAFDPAAEKVETKHAVRDPETGQFVRKDQAEHEARQRAWMDGASPAPTDRTEDELPPGVEKMARGIERWYRMRGEQPPAAAKT